MISSYPEVRDEFETIKKVLKGYSLARFGDGEMKMSQGKGYVRQLGSDRLAAELTKIVCSPSPQCIVGIPTMNPNGPKIESWIRHEARFMTILAPDVKYYSAFVSRPDSAPWIDNEEYVRSVVSLWAGKRVAVLCEKKGSLFRAVRPEARQAVHVECPRYGAYDVIDALESQIVYSNPEVVVMSCGPSATCLADRLSRRGHHAIDLGSIGGFLCRTLYSKNR
jgi:hypothetical protein